MDRTTNASTKVYFNVDKVPARAPEAKAPEKKAEETVAQEAAAVPDLSTDEATSELAPVSAEAENGMSPEPSAETASTEAPQENQPEQQS